MCQYVCLNDYQTNCNITTNHYQFFTPFSFYSVEISNITNLLIILVVLGAT